MSLRAKSGQGVVSLRARSGQVRLDVRFYKKRHEMASAMTNFCYRRKFSSDDKNFVETMSFY